MKMQKKRIVQCGLSLICAFGIALSGMSVHAEEVDSLEDKTSNLQSQLEGINQDLVTISNEIAETEVKIEESNNEVFRLEASLQISRNNEEVQYANMKTRIKYMYENGSDTLLSMICEAKSMGEFLNRVDFIQNITKYDKDMLENMVKVREGIEEQEAELKSRQQELLDLQSQLDSEQAALQAKAEETSTDLATVNAQLEAARAAQKKQEEEAQRKADEQLAKKAQEETKQASASAGSNTSAGNNNPSNNNSSNNTSSDSSNSGSGGYVIPSGGLTPSKGRIWYNGHTETYYSQKVLPGGGLAIPGRHIASDGTIRDADGYIVLASDDYPRGTVVETSLGAGKVYDTGSGSGNIDLYTDW
ncbi:coiled-coil domain-containing protein [Coprococcus comes]|uniref:coiled-coil domain-containing protein n=1 Tax=Coprococcus comes TaxID=410072 RepID=UPI00319E7307